MINARTLVLGALGTVSFSMTGFVLIPALGIDTQPITLEDGTLYPVPLSEQAQIGREVYRDLGCMYCHTQQVRPDTFGVDVVRGWGRRGSLPLDYVGQQPPMLGTMRTGPDLANIATRQPSEVWHMMHMYDPQLTSPGSNMPPFRFLFETVQGERADAIAVPEGTVPEGMSVVPGPRATALVAYLMTLQQNADVTGGGHE